MDRVDVGRYRDPSRHGFVGWVRGKLWTLFERVGGRPLLVETPEPEATAEPPRDEREAITRPDWPHEGGSKP